MIDITSLNTIFHIFLFVSLGICIYAFSYIRKSKFLKGNNNIASFFLWTILLLLCVFSVSGDYWTYMYWYEYGGARIDVHMEPIWNIIRVIIPWNYTSFRAIVWGVGLFLILKMTDFCKINRTLTFCLFGVFYLNYFSYARAAIALAFILIGFFFLYRDKDDYHSGISRWVLFVAFSTLGIMMHRSIFIIIPGLLLPFWVKLNRNTLKIIIILFPLFSLLFNLAFPYISFVASENEFVGEATQNYLSLEYNQFSRFIKEIIDRIPILILYGAAMIKLYWGQDAPTYMKKVSSAAFFIVYISFLFATIISANGITFFYRIINMAYPFMIFTITYSIQYIGQMKNVSLMCVVLAIIMQLINLRFYLFINPNYIQQQMIERYINLI